MIDQSRIEQIRLMPMAEAKSAMKAYAEELGVKVRAKTIDNMVSEMEAKLSTKRDPASIESVSTFSTRKSVTALPATIGPILGQQFAIYAKPSLIDNIETCTFQWKKDGSVIAGATGQRFVVDSAKTTDVGSYVCTITESDGTTTDSAACVVGAAVNAPVGFPLHTLFKPTWIDFYSTAFAHIGSFALAEAKELLKNCDSNAAFLTALQGSMKAFQIYSLMNSADRLILTDAKDGYPNEITRSTTKDAPINEIGRWKS